MKTKNELIQACTVNGETNWSEYRETVRSYRAALADLKERAFKDRTERRTPAETVAAWVEAVGYETAQTVLGSCVNACGDWDERISRSARTWAAGVGYDRASALDLTVYTDSIHRCHIDQLARAMMEYKPAEPETVEPEAPKAEQDAQKAPQSDEATESGTSSKEWTPAPGDIVRVSGGYHANSNGLFFIASESGRGWWLEPLTKAGKIKKNGAQSWPLVSYCSDRTKAREAARHNAQHAKLDPAPEVPTCFVAEWFRTKAAELGERAADQERRGYAWSEETRAEAEKVAAIVARFDPEDVPAPAPAPASIRFYWNGLKVNGVFLKCSYSAERNGPGVTIYGHYTNLPREFFEVVNESDSMTDYFEDDRATLSEDHPLYRFARRAALKCLASGRGYGSLSDYQLNEWTNTKDPGQPSEYDAEKARAYIVGRAEAERKAREDAEKAEREADEARCKHQRTAGAAFIRETAAAHPIKDGAPVVTVLWSEHPAFYDWEDGELKLSVSAADIILRHFDEEQHAAREAGRDEFGPVSWCYFKTKYTINYKDPQTGEASEFTDRYDLGDNNGGLCALIESYNGADHPFCRLLRENTAAGRVTAVTVAPWVAEALSRRREKAKQETDEIFSLAEMLTDEQLVAAVLRVDRTEPGADDVARFFLQELMKRDKQKAVDTWFRWKSGQAE